MARTGFSVNVSNTVMGTPPSVNANTMLIVPGTATTGSTFPIALDTPVLFKSTDDLATHGVTEEGNPEVYRHVTGFYNPTAEVDNTGTYLWVVVVGTNGTSTIPTKLPGYVRATVVNGFQYRPRQIIIANPISKSALADYQSAIMSMYDEGFSTCAIIAGDNFMPEGAIDTSVSTLDDLSTKKAGMIGVVIFTDKQSAVACTGKVGGWMASLSVGTSIGDTSLPAFGESLYMVDQGSASEYINTPCAQLSLDTINAIGDKQYIFPRTRPPKNGLWLNDGATAEDPLTALSTLEAARTIAAMVDDLRAFYTPYINGRVPIDANGRTQSSYVDVVTSLAREKVIVPYIDSGDISDARITQTDLNDDFSGTRTWQVSLEILPAPTLRWVNSFVFYVKKLN